MTWYNFIGRVRIHPSRLIRDSSGAVLAETALALPILIMLGIFIFEMSNVMRAYITVTTGIWDGTHYLARTGIPSDPTAQLRAKTLATTGSIDGTTPLLQGWGVTNISTQVISVANPINAVTGSPIYRGSDPLYIVQLSTQFTFTQGALLNAVGLPVPTITVSHSERVTGG